VSLPRLLVFTDRTRCRSDLRRVLEVVVGCGARAVVLREKDLPPAERARLVRDVRAVLAPAGARLIVAGPAGDGLIVAGPAGDAVHLSARDPFPEPRPALVGRSCHDRREVLSACREGCDYMTVSPVFPTPSKPGYGPALGLAGVTALVALAGGGRPLAYALGGVRPEDVPGCLAAGAHGVAVMGPAMRQPGVVAEYLAAIPGHLASPPEVVV
jgi:thiamine-phosphate diphosphorylase